MSLFQLSEKHFDIVKDILRQFELNECTFIFGSRAKGTAEKFSDLDICLKKKIEKTEFRKIVDAFEDSDLPIKVDVILWDEIDDNFKNHIIKDMVLFKR